MYSIVKNICQISVVGTLIVTQGCGSPKDAPMDDRFVVTDSLINNLLIDTVQQANGQTELSFSARIAANAEHKAEIFPMLSGTVRSVSVKLGDRVQAGQVLASMSSAEMAGFDKEAISASAELSTAERNARQTEELFKSGLASSRELEEAKNELVIRRAEQRRAAAVMKLNGGSTNGSYKLTAPLNGFVIEKKVTENMQLRPDNDNSLFTIADLSTVWAMINVYESDISRIREGDQVSIAILSYPEKEFSGKIDKIDHLIDNESKVMNARVTVNNPGFLLKPGMMATVKVAARSGIDLPVINTRGILFDENKSYVLVLDPEKKIRIQEIEIGRRSTDRAYISKGLRAGDRIVASKQVFLYESLKN